MHSRAEETVKRGKPLKHTPLKRKTQLKRGKQRSWNSTLPPESPKHRKHRNMTSPARREYRKVFRLCQCCCKRLALCRDCRDDLGDYSKWPIRRQLALKPVSDPGRFNLEVINEIRGRDEDAITLSDVAAYLELKT